MRPIIYEVRTWPRTRNVYQAQTEGKIMKPIISTLRKRNGRGIAGYRATFGPVSADGISKVLATDACKEAVRAALVRLEEGAVIGRLMGHVYIVSPNTSGWEYWIDTSAAGFCTSMNHPTKTDAVHAAIHHLAQNLWTKDTDDCAFLGSLPSSVQRDLAGWIAFQRVYLSLGEHPGTDAHRFACDHSSRYAREHFPHVFAVSD